MAFGPDLPRTRGGGAGLDRSRAVESGDHAAVFEVRLPAGPAELETWFYDQDGVERGAYFVYV